MLQYNERSKPYQMIDPARPKGIALTASKSAKGPKEQIAQGTTGMTAATTIPAVRGRGGVIGVWQHVDNMEQNLWF
jgi:hypothetical protein